jgi:hypothetical protein
MPRSRADPINARAHARGARAAIHMISLAFLTTWGKSGAKIARNVEAFGFTNRIQEPVRLMRRLLVGGGHTGSRASIEI